jgi:hypothetical protein
MYKDSTSKILGSLLIGLLAVNFFFVIYIVITNGDNYKELERKYAELSTEIEGLQNGKLPDGEQKSTDSTVEFLKGEYSNYTDFANSDRESFFNLVSLFFVALGVLVTGAIIVIYWIFGQTKNEVKENADLTIRSSIIAIEEDAKNQIQSLVDPKIQDFEEKYKELERFMENQQFLRKSRVLVLCPESKRVEMERLGAMRIRGIVNEVKLMDLSRFEDFEQRVNDGEVDIIIYRYEKADGNLQEETIRGYIQKLMDFGSLIPMVVYAPFGTRVDGQDSDFINKYPYSAIANLPTTLTSNMISLANVISYMRR